MKMKLYDANPRLAVRPADPPHVQLSGFQPLFMPRIPLLF